MLKTIRKTIVGMMNRLRMAMSLKPRLAAADLGSSLSIIEVRPLRGEGSPRGETLCRYAPIPCRRAVKARRRAVLSAGSGGLLVSLVLLERGFPVVGQAVQGFFGRALVAHDERMQTLVHLVQQLRVLLGGPEVLHHEHGLIERFVVRGGLTELFRRQHLGVAGIAAELGPLLLHVVADEPRQELHRLGLLLGVFDDRYAQAAHHGKAPTRQTHSIRYT